MIDGDVFRIIVPLDDEYSYDAGVSKVQDSVSSQSIPIDTPSILIDTQPILSDRKSAIINWLETRDKVTTSEVATQMGITTIWARKILQEMTSEGSLEKIGNYRYTYYILKKYNTEDV